MSTQREEAVIVLGIDLAKIEPGLRSAGQKIEAFAERVKGMFASIGAAITVGGAIAEFNRLRDAVEDIQRISQGTGISAGLVQDLQNVARASGVAGDAVEAMLDKFAAHLAPGSDPDVALNEFADKLAAIEDPGERARMAVEAFGKSGVKLIPILSKGSEGLREFADEFQRISDEQIELIDSMDQRMDEWGHNFHVTIAKGIELWAMFIKALKISAKSPLSGNTFDAVADEKFAGMFSKFFHGEAKKVVDKRKREEDDDRKERVKANDLAAKRELSTAVKGDKDKEVLARKREKALDEHLKKLQDIWFNNPVPSQPRDPGSPNRPGPHGDPGNAPGPGGDAGNPIQNHLGDIDAITQEQGLANMNVKAGNLEWARMRQGRINAAKDRLVNNLQKEMNDQNNKSPRDMLIDEIMKRLKGGMDKKGAIPVAVMDDDE